MSYRAVGQHLVTNQGIGKRILEALISTLEDIVLVPEAKRMITLRETTGNGDKVVSDSQVLTGRSLTIDGKRRSGSDQGPEEDKERGISGN